MEKKDLVKYRIMNIISMVLMIIGFCIITNGDFSAYNYIKPIINIVLNIIAMIISIIAFNGSRKKSKKIDILSFMIMIFSIVFIVSQIGCMLITMLIGGGIYVLYTYM